MDKYITDYLADNAKKFASKPALVFEGQTLTWSELYQTVIKVSNGVLEKLDTTNESEQQIVGILLPNSIDFIKTYLGIIHAGHIAMPLDPNFKNLETQTVVKQMQPKFIVTNETYESHFSNKDIWCLPSELGKSGSSSNVLRLNPKTQAASMLFTSGTTGNPKSVPYTHANHMWNPAAVSELWNWSEDDTILLSLPLSHWHGLVMGLDGALYHGNTIYLQAWFDAKATVEMLQSGKISLFMHVPIAYSKLVEFAAGKKVDISSVRLCIAGSSYLPPSLWNQFNKYYGKEILERYGANEMGLLTSNTLDKRLPGCVGKLLDGVEVIIQEDGEIAMKSPGLFPGYWNNQEATNKQRIENGYWLSGDIGEFDKDSRLHLKGRIQEKMKKYGYTVYPRDVEWAMAKHPKVDEVVVLSIQKEDSLSDEFVYFIVGEISDQEVHDFAKKEMPNFWRPDRIVHLDSIPRTGRTSKPSLNDLRALVQ